MAFIRKGKKKREKILEKLNKKKRSRLLGNLAGSLCCCFFLRTSRRLPKSILCYHNAFHPPGTRLAGQLGLVRN